MLQTSLEKIAFIVVKAREYDVPEDVVEDDPGSNPTDEGDRMVLAAYPDDPTYEELKTFIDDLNEDEQAELVALVWLGRGDYDARGWSTALREARARHTGSTAEYLLGEPLLADLLEEGLAALGSSITQLEEGHL